MFLGSKGQFRPGGQPALTSQTYADDFNEVKSVGAKNSTTRTQAQTDQAMLWSEPAVQQALRSMRTFINDRNLDIVDAARFSAMIGGTYEEGMLGCFDAKYALPAWRPVTAIRHADTDGNPATERDESWEPLLGTPNHPEYPSAHSCVTVGVAKAVETFLGSAPFSYTITSVAGRPSVTFTSATDLAKHVGEARIYSGIHFRQATIDGGLLGRQVASLVAAKFVPAASGGTVPLPPNTGTNGTGTRDGANTAVIGGVLLVALAATGALWYRRRTVAP